MPAELRSAHEKPWPTAITSAALVGLARSCRGSHLRAVCAACVAAITMSGSPVSAEEAGGAPAWQVQTLVTAHRFIPDEPRADLDQPSLRYGLHGGRWKASFELLAESPALSRALLPPGGRLHLAVGWFHESDHAANQEDYIEQYLAPPSFLPGQGRIEPSLDNGNFSSYEYVKLRAVYRQPLFRGLLTAQSALGARLFPGAIDPGSIRALRVAALAEARLTVRVSDGVRPFASAYYELLANDFDAEDHGFLFGLDRTPLRYEIVHLGVDLVSKSGGIWSPYLTYSSSHGRGIDFPKFSDNEIGFGITLLP